MKPGAININKDRKTGKASSTDYGLMQKLNPYSKAYKDGVIKKSEDLITKPCLNIHIGSWILARHFQICGVSWNCLGSYNADSVRTDMKQESNMPIKYGEFIVT
uniref:Transglycosylase SLT domain protein n=1 Tax=Klebsiella pneumoniae TaxID=573 RepID=A0A8D6UFT6_KLEPN